MFYSQKKIHSRNKFNKFIISSVRKSLLSKREFIRWCKSNVPSSALRQPFTLQSLNMYIRIYFQYFSSRKREFLISALAAIHMKLIIRINIVCMFYFSFLIQICLQIPAYSWTFKLQFAYKLHYTWWIEPFKAMPFNNARQLSVIFVTQRMRKFSIACTLSFLIDKEKKTLCNIPIGRNNFHEKIERPSPLDIPAQAFTSRPGYRLRVAIAKLNPPWIKCLVTRMSRSDKSPARLVFAQFTRPRIRARISCIYTGAAREKNIHEARKTEGKRERASLKGINHCYRLLKPPERGELSGNTGSPENTRQPTYTRIIVGSKKN